MPNYTPGPWKCSPFLTPDKDDDPVLVYKVEAGTLAQRYSALDMDYEDDEEAFVATADSIHSENEANARLIAAAPLLLEAVKLFMAQYGGDSPERANRPEQVAARAALALVEGA